MRQIDRRAKAVWANTNLQMTSLYKPGGIGIVFIQSVAGQIKESGFDRKGRWAYQVFDSGSDFHSVVFSFYRCCKTSLQGTKTAYMQQRVLQSELGLRGSPLKWFQAELIKEIRRFQGKYGTNLRPYIFGDFNYDNHIETTINAICHEFKLVDIYSYLHPNTTKFNTYS